jgi:CxxC motif-containing protein
MKKEMVCINCPRGCHLVVDTETMTVTGNTCIRGKNYGISEVTNPVRTVTSTAKISGGEINRVSVKTDKPISKKLIFSCMDEINKLSLKAPINIGDILIKNVLNTGSNIIATKSVGKKNG